MNVLLWVIQGLVAVAFVAAGFNHATRRDRATGRMAWMLALPKPAVTTIGVLEALGGVGLVLPRATGILPWLTPLAAVLLAVLMVCAAIFHARRGEVPLIAANVVLGALAVVAPLIGSCAAAMPRRPRPGRSRARRRLDSRSWTTRPSARCWTR
jgi:uncharacterized membrane protein